MGGGSREKIFMKQREREKFLVLERGDTEWLPLCHSSDSWKGNLSLHSVSSGRNSCKEIKSPCLMTSAVPSLEILPYPGELSESCDVTCVLEMPTALKTHSFSACKTPRF